MTFFVPAYDVEHPEFCPRGLRRILGIHEELAVPATFFVVGRLLEEDAPTYRGLLDRPWADIQSHTYSHLLLRDSKVHGAGCRPEEARREIELGKRLVEDTFGRPCVGLRTGCGFEEGLSGRGDLLGFLRGAGYEFVSSALRGPGDTLPAPLRGPSTYAADGYPELLELPGHGWHDNVLTAPEPGRLPIVAWPPLEDWFLPPRRPATPEEAAEVYTTWVEKAAERGLPYVSLVWHPGSLHRFDGECRTVRLVLERARRLGLEFCTYARLARGFREVEHG